MDLRKSSRSLVAGLLGATVMSACLAAAEPAHAGAMNGVGVPAVRARDVLRHYSLHTLAGDAVSLPSLQGEVVVLSFWASWCSPCRREMPRLDVLNAELVKKGGRVYAVSIDEQRDNVDRFARVHSLRLPIVHDGPQGLARELDLRSIPFTLVLDRNGEVAYTTSRSDEAGMNALAAATRQLIAREPLASEIHEGAQP